MHAIQSAARISDCDTMTDKLIYQIRTGQITGSSLNTLGARCRTELHELRQELDELLRELREIAGNNSDGNQVSRTIAA
ncbi:hypothetical protein [Paenibacillus mendelii]|uniref:Uncharacterized protein n=1 Tax=Paenibacillus mendelii TaxID=206163 RepID=A0ABV6J7T5_9BACL|nr:hypothetical protein [Paenibacillus mendelii]MCQ6561112.1 hypothetical protein [Paenibacillus mendelii]